MNDEGTMSTGQYREALRTARCELDCERLLHVYLPHVVCSKSARAELAQATVARRFHFALTAEGSRGGVAVDHFHEQCSVQCA